MNSMDYVDRKIEEFISSGMDKPDVIRNTAPLTLEWPYVFGSWGERCTPDNRRKRKSDDHPTIVTKCQVLNGSRNSCGGCKWNLPVRMFDCRGYTHWLLQQVGIKLIGEGCTSQWNNADNWDIKGPISEMPKDKVCCVFKGTDKTKEHTGMYMGDGDTIYDCSSGVQKHSITNKTWKYYGIPKGLYNGIQPQPEPSPEPSPDPEPGTAVVTGNQLALRKGPGTNYSVLTRIPNGSTVTLQDDGWSYVEYKGQRGYVMDKYIQKG